jgi:hypothetical protein
MTFALWQTFLIFVLGNVLGFYAAATLCVSGKDDNNERTNHRSNQS